MSFTSLPTCQEMVTMDPPPGFRRAHASTPPGTWSDDGAQMLALLDSLLERGRLDAEDLGQALRRVVRLNESGASYEEVVRAAIALGHDTDTTACVAGGIAGLVHGVNSIPGAWLDALRGRNLVDPLLERLVQR